MSDIRVLTAKLIADISEFKANLSAAVTHTDKSTMQMSEKIKRLGGEITSIGTKMTMGLTLPIVAVGVAVTKMGGDFEKSMAKSTAIMGTLSDAMKNDMKNAALEMSTKITFSASQMAEAYYYLASAGLTAKQSMAALPAVSKFAAAGQFDLARATEYLTDAQASLGMKTNDAASNLTNMTRVADVLTQANNIANGSVEQFSQSLTNKAGSALRLLNKDVEEGVAVLAAYADQGVKGQLAGEQLSIVLRDLQRASLLNKRAFADAGIQVYDTSGKMNNMADIIGGLETHLAGMSDEQKRAAITSLGFQERSVAAMLTLVGTTDKIRAYEKALRAAGGTTDDVARKQMMNFNDQMVLLGNRVAKVAIELFDGGFGRALKEYLVPALDAGVVALEKFTTWFNQLSKPAQNTVIAITLVVAALGPLLVVLGTSLTAFASFKIIMMAAVPVATSLGGALKILMGTMLKMLIPLGLIVLKVVAVLAVFAAAAVGANYLVRNWDSMSARVKEIFWGIVDVIATVFAQIFRKFSDLPIVGKQFETMAKKLEAVSSDAMAKVGENMNTADKTAVGFGDSVRGLVDDFKYMGKAALGAFDFGNATLPNIPVPGAPPESGGSGGNNEDPAAPMAVLSTQAQILKDMMDELAKSQDAIYWFKDTRTEAELLNFQLQNLNTLYERGAISQETYERAQKKLREAMWQSNATLVAISGSFENNFANAATSFVTSTMTMRQALTSMVNGMLADFARMAAISIFKKLIGGPLMGLLGGSTGGGGLLGSANGNVFTGHIQPFANGGVTNGTIAFPMNRGIGVAGERGRQEGILPLKRTQDGQLGVRADLSGGENMLGAEAKPEQKVIVIQVGARELGRTIVDLGQSGYIPARLGT